MLRELADRLFAAAGVEVEHREAEVAGVRTHWVEAGPPDGPPALLVHGAFGAGALWYSALPTLVAEGLRVVAADAPGHGESAIPSWRPESTPQGMLGWTDELAERLGSPLYVGHSYGGYLGVLAWLRRPGRFPAMVLVASAGLARGRSRWLELLTLPALGELLFARTVSRKGLERMARRMAPLADAIPHGQLALDYMQSVNARPGYGRFRLALVRGTNQVTRDPAWQTADRVSEIDCPALLAAGPRDFLPIEDARRAARVMPRAALVELPGTGHLCYLEDAAAFNSALGDFVGNLHLVAANRPRVT